MTTEIKAPTFPESVADGTIATWHIGEGESIKRDQPLVDIETDKVVLEVVAPADGVLSKLIKPEGEVVLSEEVIAEFTAGEVTATPKAAANEVADTTDDEKISPAARKLLSEQGRSASGIQGTGKNGLITKEDVLAAEVAPAPKAAEPPPAAAPKAAPAPMTLSADGERPEKRITMTRMRAKIAERLHAASQDTAMLTTFNEVDMAPIMKMRGQYKQEFEKRHDVKLGFMGFFVKAATEALKKFPMVNASIDGNEIVYHGYQDVGIAVSTEKGLVVPILRDTDYMRVADIEIGISDFASRAKTGKLSIDEMQGGTFTITNGGVFGSLMSTPIINPPQAAILGMHKIQERAVVVNGEVVVRPMMYLALSYDHRLIDGKDSVQFLVAVKETLEDPARMLLDL